MSPMLVKLTTAGIASADSADPPVKGGVLSVIREWADILVSTFTLVAFFRLFIVDVYKIPSGSMTPTLFGGWLAKVDFNRDGRPDWLMFDSESEDQVGSSALLFLNDGRRCVGRGAVRLPVGLNVDKRWRSDRILVSKLAYWFGRPRRGDVVVFKPPRAIWRPEGAIFVKRCVGEPGDQLTFDNAGHLFANGRRLTRPAFFDDQTYLTTIPLSDGNLYEGAVTYHPDGFGRVQINRIDVPQNQIYAFGDNTFGSFDSRYWGGVPLENLKGKALWRVWPPWRIGRLTER